METSLAVQMALAVLLQVYIYLLFGKYLVPRWKVVPQIAFYLLISWIIATSLGWWALIWIAGHPALGVFAHASWCRNNGIDWKTCEPREEYLRLRPWGAEDEFASAD